MIIDNLIKLNKVILKNTSQINNIKPLLTFLNNYKGCDWQKYVQYKRDSYNRNTVFRTDNYEIVIISWLPNQETPIHGHPRNGCLFKLLDGTLQEKLFLSNGLIKIKNYSNDNIVNTSYIDDKVGLHKMKNISYANAVSLHIYSPPY